jgi:transposase
MPIRHCVQLNDKQRSQLERLIRVGKSAARVQTRARILLLADAGESTPAIAQALLTSEGTVQRIRKRFALEGLDSALYDRPRPGRPPRITGATIPVYGRA